MREDILEELLPRLKSDFDFRQVKGVWWQQGKCPSCQKRELFTRSDNPWTLKCGRANNCGREIATKDEYPEIFDVWSKRHKKTPENPYAAADAYLLYARRLRLNDLRGAYTQETYRDQDRNLFSETIRFQLPGGSYWERLIDQPSRFEKKAHFKAKASYRGHCWMAPDQGIEALARADRVWICEGIFDALSWRQAGEFAVSAMSCNNYPEHWLESLRKACADLNVAGPELIFAFDIGKAGTEYTRKFVAKAIKEGWRATAAQALPEGETRKIDWNDLLARDLKKPDGEEDDTPPDPRGRLAPQFVEDYLWNGKVLLAKSATDKAVLLYEKHERPSFSFVHDSRTWWASVDAGKVQEVMDKERVTARAAIRGCTEVSQVANCAFQILYFQQDETSGESHYYLSIDLAANDGIYRKPFAPSALVAGAEFKKALMGAAPGALWEGSTRQLDRLVSAQTPGLKTVETLDFTGYSRDHGAYIFGDLAVKDGRVVKINEEDFFDLGKRQVKLRATKRVLKNAYDAESFDTSWLPYLWTAWRGNGMAVLVFWTMSYFAEQIRKEYASLGYLEMFGKANTGKSTIIMWMWKLTGWVDEVYEGIDPSKSTMVGYIRTLSRAANLPVVFVESDRSEEGPHVKKFDWSEIKGLFNGNIGRATGKKSQGNDTNEPPFRGALVIEQNDPVVSGEPVLSRIMQTEWTKKGWSPATKAAAEKIEKWDREEASGYLIHVVKREQVYLKTMREVFPKWERHLIDIKVQHSRVRKCHAQLHAGLDALAAVMNIPADIMAETHQHFDQMALSRDASIESDHPKVAKFWEIFDHLENEALRAAEKAANRADRADKSFAVKDPDNLFPQDRTAVMEKIQDSAERFEFVDHSKDENLIAVNLLQFEQAMKRARIDGPTTDELKKYLRHSKSRPFVDIKPINSKITNKTTHCWVFKDKGN